MTASTALVVLQSLLFAEALAACLREPGALECLVIPFDELLAPKRREEPDRSEFVILLELLPDARDNARVFRRVQSRWPGGRTILFTSQAGAEEITELFRQGAWGVFSPGDPVSALRKAVLSVGNGEIWACRQDSSAIIRHLRSSEPKPKRPDGKTLSRREEHVLSLVAGGLKNRQIADRLCISEQTVKVHLNAIFRKIGVRDRLQAALFAIDRGFTPGKIPVGS